MKDNYSPMMNKLCKNSFWCMIMLVEKLKRKETLKKLLKNRLRSNSTKKFGHMLSLFPKLKKIKSWLSLVKSVFACSKSFQTCKKLKKSLISPWILFSKPKFPHLAIKLFKKFFILPSKLKIETTFFSCWKVAFAIFSRDWGQKMSFISTLQLCIHWLFIVFGNIWTCAAVK